MPITAGTVAGITASALGLTGVASVGICLAQLEGIIPANYATWGWPAICGAVMGGLIYTLYKVTMGAIERPAKALESIATSLGGIHQQCSDQATRSEANGDKLDQMQRVLDRCSDKLDK